MALKAIYDKLEEIPTEYQSLYSERNDKFELTGITGVKTEADLDRSAEALRKEKVDHKQTKDKLTNWNSLNTPFEDVTAKLDKIPELEAAASGNIDEEKLKEMSEARAKTLLSPVERERDQLKVKNVELTGQVQGFEEAGVKRSIHDGIRIVATKLKVIPEAVEDILMHGERIFEVSEDGKVLTKDNVGTTPGLEVEAWLTDQRDKRAHWWPDSQGGGAGGSGKGGIGGINPWSEKDWNLTAQGKVANEKGMDKAKQLAEMVGSKIGATSPPPKK